MCHLAGVIAAHPVVADRVPRHLERPPILVKPFPVGASVCLAKMVVGKVLTSERRVPPPGLVDYRDVRLDPAVLERPAVHLGTAVPVSPTRRSR